MTHNECRKIYWKALRDHKLIRPQICSKCNKSVNGRRIQGHHKDYEKPLDVEWLCVNCHSDVHSRDLTYFTVKVGHATSEATRRKIGKANSIALRGRKLSKEHCKHISDFLIGKPSRMLGKHHSEQTLEKMSESHKGHEVSKETRIKIGKANSIALKGHKVSKETKRKISNFFKGYKFSEEAKRNMSKVKLGHKVSNETKLKISKTLREHNNLKRQEI